MKSKTKAIWLILMVGVMVLIFCLSNQSSEISSKVSDAVAEGINIQPENDWTTPSLTKVAFGLDIRKLAHIGLFGLLGVTAIGLTSNVLWASVICFAYAISDEIHQLFVPGRTSSPKDVLIDAIGFLIVFTVWKIIAIAVNYRKKTSLVDNTVVMEEEP